ncbi:MAG: trimeric autotransporter adhesin, partial [Thermoanaerobaculia bacterium]|nr:trimeric autotransporter adhesin [Thermoanaerobaculia bacterium]
MKRVAVIAVVLLAASQLQAFKAKPGFVKVELASLQDTDSPMPVADLIAHFGGEDVAYYNAFHIVYLPKGLLVAFQKSANAAGFRVRAREDLDRIDAPGAAVDARDGIHGAGNGNLIRTYPAARRGLYLLQFMGPVKAEWSAALTELGWNVVGYLPSNAYIIAGKPSLVAATSNLPFVQFLDFYHPFEKAAGFAHDANLHDVIVEVSPVDDRQPTIDAVSKLSATAVRVDSYPNDVYVHARLSERDAAQLLSDPLVIGIGSEPVTHLSDERVAASLTTNVTANGSQPTTPTGYASWLTSQCFLCTAANMPAATWRVGIADTGLDGGNTGSTHHPDLANREYWGAIFATVNDAC